MTSILVEQLLAGSPLALAKIISLVENDAPQSSLILDTLHSHIGKAIRLGVTGPPGAGKSTLVDQITTRYRQQGHKVGIIMVDPTSPFTGGALLGDRLRVRSHLLDDKVFIRSMASRGAAGGLAVRTQEVGDVLDAAGFEIIIFETVGVGQVELDVVEAVDTTLLVLVPESGDDIQFMKAGLIEIADIFIINKADRQGSRQLEQILKQILELNTGDQEWEIPVCRTSAHSGDGVAKLFSFLIEHQRYLRESGRQAHLHRLRLQQRVFTLVREHLEGQFWTDNRRTMLDDNLDSLSPYRLAQLILEHEK